MNKKIVWGVVAVLIVIIVVSNAALNNKPLKGPVKIGVISSLSGLVENGDNLGQGFANGVILAQEEYLKGNSDANFVVALEDDNYDSKKGMSAYQKLVSVDKINSLINLSSPTIDVIKSDVQSKGFPVLQLGAESQVESDNVFQMYPDQTSVKMLGDVANKEGIHSVTVVMEQVKAYEKFVSDFVQAFSGTTTIVRIPATEKEYASTALKIKQNNSDAILIFTSSKVGARVINRLNQIGYKPHKLYFDLGLQLGLNDYKELLGNTTTSLEGAEALFSISKTDPAFAARYKARFSSEPGFLSGYGYDSYNVMVLNYHSDNTLWLKNIQKYIGEGVTGKISFDGVGLRPAEFTIATLRNGELVIQ